MEGREQPPPADRKEQVVGAQNGERGREVERVGVGEPRKRVRPHVAEHVTEEGEEDGDDGELQPDEHTPAAKERRKPARHCSRV